MQIHFKIEPHIYAEEELHDEFLEDDYSCGIMGPEVVLPLRRNKNTIILFEYSQDSCIKDALDAIIQVLHQKSEEEFFRNAYHIYFVCKDKRYCVYDMNANFQRVLERYLDPEMTGTVIVQVFASADAGTVCDDEGLRYFMHTHENGKHNEPHVHVRDTGYQYEASLAISDGRILAGDLPRKLLKKAQRKVLSEQPYFYQCWNTMTDGLQVDINKHFKIITY